MSLKSSNFARSFTTNFLRYMKRFVFLVCLALVFAGCSDAAKDIAGNYSYKISGSAIIKGDTVALPHEMGAMEIVRLSADSVLITFNAMEGPAYATNAGVSDSHIVLKELERNLTYNTQLYPVTVNGQGERFEQTLLFELSYHSTDVDAEKLTLLCKRN